MPSSRASLHTLSLFLFEKENEQGDDDASKSPPKEY